MMTYAVKIPKYSQILIEKDHLDDWSPEMDCRLRLMFGQQVWKPSSESSLDSEDGLSGCQNVSRKQQPFSGLQSPR